MLIMSLNINDFGGTSEHLQEHKTANGHIDWSFWKNRIYKIAIIDKLKDIINRKKPSVIIIQEFEHNNSPEPIDFIKWMKEQGYEVKGNIPTYKVSMTLLFVKIAEFSEIAIKHSKTEINARDYAVCVGGYIIYGTHIPLNSKNRPNVREDYWDEVIAFYEEHSADKVVLIGDFNTFDKSTPAYKKYQTLCEKGAIDLWLNKGNPDDTATEIKFRKRLDYVFISPSVEEYIVSMDIDSGIMDEEKISDHAVLFLELK